MSAPTNEIPYRELGHAKGTLAIEAVQLVSTDEVLLEDAEAVSALSFSRVNLASHYRGKKKKAGRGRFIQALTCLLVASLEIGERRIVGICNAGDDRNTTSSDDRGEERYRSRRASGNGPKQRPGQGVPARWHASFCAMPQGCDEGLGAVKSLPSRESPPTVQTQEISVLRFRCPSCPAQQPALGLN